MEERWIVALIETFFRRSAEERNFFGTRCIATDFGSETYCYSTIKCDLPDSYDKMSIRLEGSKSLSSLSSLHNFHAKNCSPRSTTKQSFPSRTKERVGHQARKESPAHIANYSILTN